jgi:hypothetical protein
MPSTAIAPARPRAQVFSPAGFLGIGSFSNEWVKVRIKVAPEGPDRGDRFEERNGQLTRDDENDPEVAALLES